MEKNKNFIILILLLHSFMLISQTNEQKDVNFKKYNLTKSDTILLNYETILINKLADYDFGKSTDGIVINDKLFNNKLNKIFNAVVFSSSDLNTNGSSIGFIQSTNNQTVSLSSFTKLPKNNLYLKLGVTASGSSSPFNFYSANQWSSNVGGNVGFIYKLQYKSTYFTDPDAEKNAVKRLKYIDSIVKVKIVYDKDSLIDKKIKSLDSSKPNYYRKKDSLLLIKTKIDKFKNTFKDNIVIKDFDDLSSRKKFFYPSPFLVKPSMTEVLAPDIAKNYVKDEMESFDKKNDITNGYKLNWLDFNIALSNSTFKFEKDNIETNLYDSLNNSLGFDKKQNKLNIGVQFGYHHTRNNLKRLYYYNISAGFNSGSFLSSNLITGTPKILQDLTIGDESNINNASIKGDFNSIDNTLSYMNVSFYGALFFGKSQKFGFNINLKHFNKIHVPDGVFYQNNFTALIGPIFKATGADGKGVIVGLDFGYDNVLIKSAVNNNFTARLRLGIPFNIYKKAEK